MMSLWDALRMNMMISYQELVRTFLSFTSRKIFSTSMAGSSQRQNTLTPFDNRVCGLSHHNEMNVTFCTKME
ncbi:hypothetical protein EMF04_25365 [Klebsiella pneumoniae]|nr:hypothetical protein EMH18_24710 [Klebsiella pneumoniae]TMZ38984.1 hypothetical protein EME58_25220 [Klebsiella pneumoniae]TMZ66153.1 hypothetical protein EMF01_25230 [Klebsiella pneumoniae]TMZ82425.1 hypothetical protein EME68_24935 [Klebsiella pneumoniae]TNA91123.1 hypothetical protein EME37_25455 [Klebsiella pneumoniae]